MLIIWLLLQRSMFFLKEPLVGPQSLQSALQFAACLSVLRSVNTSCLTRWRNHIPSVVGDRGSEKHSHKVWNKTGCVFSRQEWRTTRCGCHGYRKRTWNWRVGWQRCPCFTPQVLVPSVTSYNLSQTVQPL